MQIEGFQTDFSLDATDGLTWGRQGLDAIVGHEATPPSPLKGAALYYTLLYITLTSSGGANNTPFKN